MSLVMQNTKLNNNKKRVKYGFYEICFYTYIVMKYMNAALIKLIPDVHHLRPAVAAWHLLVRRFLWEAIL